MRKILIASSLLLTATSPVTAQTFLDKLVSKATKPKAPGGSAPAQGRFTASMAPAQTEAIDRLLAQPMQDQRTSADRAAAAGLIRTLLGIGACATAPQAWNAINRDSVAPYNFGSLGGDSSYVAMFGLRYHDKSRCLSVLRLGDWSKPADNALRFRTYYVSDESGEAKNQTYELQRLDGRWMFREMGLAY